MSDLIKWFQRRRETKALTTVQRHLTVTTGIVEDLEKAISAAIGKDEREAQRCIRRVAKAEKEADTLRRRVMNDISRGELPPIARADLMDLVKKVDMVADWSRESTRILGAIPMEQVPTPIMNEFIEMVLGAKECAISLQKCVNKTMTRPEEALESADAVEREEEKVDDMHEKAKKLLGNTSPQNCGVTVLVAQLFEAIEMIADSCEDACDQVRVILVRR